jgi:hypothetical protein
MPDGPYRVVAYRLAAASTVAMRDDIKYRGRWTHGVDGVRLRLGYVLARSPAPAKLSR